MKTYIKRLYSNLISILRAIFKGRYKLIMTTNSSNMKVLQVTTVHGQEIEIHCQENKFLIRYDRAWIPNNKYSVFKIWAITNNSDNEKLNRALETELYIPRFFHERISDDLTNKHMANAYLDIVLDKLNRQQAFATDETTT